MAQEKSTQIPSSRGRPRDKLVDAALLDACITVLGDEGFGNSSLAKIAARAGSTRAAIYRRWPNKTKMAVAAVTRLFEMSLIEFQQTGIVFIDVRALLCDVIRLLSDDRSLKAIASVVAAAHHVTDAPELRGFVRARRGIVMRDVLENGVKTGQLPKSFDVELAIDALVGPLFYRFLVLGIPMFEKDVDTLISMSLPQEK